MIRYCLLTKISYFNNEKKHVRWSIISIVNFINVSNYIDNEPTIRQVALQDWKTNKKI